MILCFILTSCSDTCVFLEMGVGLTASTWQEKGGDRKRSRNILHICFILGGRAESLGTGKSSVSDSCQDFVLLQHNPNCQNWWKVSSQFDILNVSTNTSLFDQRVTHIISTCQSISGVTMKSPNPCILCHPD